MEHRGFAHAALLAVPLGDWHINHVLHMMAVVQLRTRTAEGHAYYDRKTAAVIR